MWGDSADSAAHAAGAVGEDATGESGATSAGERGAGRAAAAGLPTLRSQDGSGLPKLRARDVSLGEQGGEGGEVLDTRATCDTLPRVVDLQECESQGGFEMDPRFFAEVGELS